METALGGPVSETGHYDSGDRVPLAPGVTDVAHEFNCTFESGDGTQARAWVFAGPVAGRARGTSLVREARGGEGLRRGRGCAGLRHRRPSRPTAAARKPATSAFTRQRAVRGRLAQLPADRLTTAAGTRAETVRRGEQWCAERWPTTLGARP